MNISDVIKFIHEQRDKRGQEKVLRNWTDAHIVSAVYQAIKDDTFGWVTQGEKITGIAWGRKRDVEKRIMHIESVVCADKRSLAHLMLLFQSKFPDWTIEGMRKKHKVHKLTHFQRINRFVHLVQL